MFALALSSPVSTESKQVASGNADYKSKGIHIYSFPLLCHGAAPY